MNQKEKALILDKAGIDRALTRISHEILEKNKGAKELVLVGIQRGGVHIAKRLAAKIKQIEGLEPPVGSLDITMYRDDLATRKSQPVPQATDITFDIQDKMMVLVDDVIFTGQDHPGRLEQHHGLRQTAPHPACRARGPRAPGTADPR